MKPPRSLVFLIIGLTRIAGAVFCVAGVSFFVLAWQERSFEPVALGVIAILLGLVGISIRAVPGAVMEYGLFRRRR